MTYEEILVKLQAWGEVEQNIKAAQADNDALRKQIEEAVFILKQDVVTPFGYKCIMTSKGSFDWESIAKSFEPNDAVIINNTEVHWNKVAEIAAPSTIVLALRKKEFYNPGIAFAQCRIK